MFVWRYLDASGADAGASESFGTKDEAEAWMGEVWADLLERGVERVELADDGRLVYRMGLREA